MWPCREGCSDRTGLRALSGSESPQAFVLGQRPAGALNHIKQGFPPKCIEQFFTRQFSPCRCQAWWLLEAALLSSGYRCPQASCLLLGAALGELEAGGSSEASPLEHSVGRPALGRSASLAEHLLCLNQLLQLSTLPTPNLAFRRTLIFMYKLKIAQKLTPHFLPHRQFSSLAPAQAPGGSLVNAALCAAGLPWPPPLGPQPPLAAGACSGTAQGAHAQRKG